MVLLPFSYTFAGSSRAVEPISWIVAGESGAGHGHVGVAGAVQLLQVWDRLPFVSAHGLATGCTR